MFLIERPESDRLIPGSVESMTISLLRIIGSPLIEEIEASQSLWANNDLYMHSLKNKVGPLYLGALRRRGILDKSRPNHGDEYDLKKFVDCIGKVSAIMNKAAIDNAILKTAGYSRGLTHNDVDVLTFGNDRMYKQCVVALLSAGYKPQVGSVDLNLLRKENRLDASEKLIKPTYGEKGSYGIYPSSGNRSSFDRKHTSPNEITLIDPEYGLKIDIHKEIGMSHVIYLDKNKLKRYVDRITLLNGKPACFLKPEVDLAVVMAHSVLKEQMYCIADYYYFIDELLEMDEERINTLINVIFESQIVNAARLFTTITAALSLAAYGMVPGKLRYIVDRLGFLRHRAVELAHRGFELPYKYSVSEIARALLEKTRDKLFRKSLVIQAGRTLDPRLAKLIMLQLAERRTRETLAEFPEQIRSTNLVKAINTLGE